MLVYEGDFLKTVASKLMKEGCRVYAPSEIAYTEINHDSQISDVKPKKSVKEFLFPQNEVLIGYGDWIEKVPLNRERRAVVGVKPCDARAIKLLDRIFLEGFEDPYYRARRENTIIISSSCEPDAYCFCESFSSPFSEEGADIFVSRIDGISFVKAVSEKGKEVLKGFESDLRNPTDQEIEKFRNEEERVRGLFRRSVEAEIQEKMKEKFDSEIWKEIAIGCVGCGTCTFLCPTCFCFDMLDEGEKKGIRYRAWDSCQFPLYTLESSSHNPRREKWQRLRNRFYDKFLYMVESKGNVFCVGCGRCISECPAGVDIVEVLQEVSR